MLDYPGSIVCDQPPWFTRGGAEKGTVTVTAPLTDEEIRAAKHDAMGFGLGEFHLDELDQDEGVGRLFYVQEQEEYAISDEIEPHVGEPIARMLNMFPRLLDEVERLRGEIALLRGRMDRSAGPKCSCSHEAGDSKCDVHPTCVGCGAANTAICDRCKVTDDEIVRALCGTRKP